MKTQVIRLQMAAQKSGRRKFMDFSTRGNTQSPLTGPGNGLQRAHAQPLALLKSTRRYAMISLVFVTYQARCATASNRNLRSLQPVRARIGKRSME